MVQVKFKKFGSNSAFGGFAPGDMIRVSADMAKHLVDQGVAAYVEAPAAAAPVDEPVPVVTRRGRKNAN